ncbi:helicase-exonuclease AddAB subunit AddB [Anaerosporobacter faecicola]|uniref:helicase-exonuclease AddAB subunit AddB n=1 Tax=Anaerosporobacter faecicola TaxID=2718714 RepID=UPI00143A493A|nr:helicase-exonuclease AddAB subunit AddB [Anaerosporobacter faecicola]
MSLQLILGSSGAGKSHRLYQEIVSDSLKNPETNYLVIVPEQFTMQTQRDMVAAHPNHGIMNIDILSFMRLAYRVFDELGGQDKTVLEDTGKSMILRKIVEQKKEELHIFQSNVKKNGFIDELKSMLSEIYQYCITPEQLEQTIEQVESRPMLKSKLQDILVVYRGFQDYIEEKYITTEEILDVLYDKVEESTYVKECVICFDGFTGFTPSQTKLLTKLMRLCKKVYVTVTIDEREQFAADEEYQLFHMSKKMIASLQEIAIEQQVPMEKPLWMVGQGKARTPYRFLESPGLAALEKNLFRYPRVTYTKEVEDLSLHVAQNPASEVAFTIVQIKKLIQEQGYRYKDIAVVSGDMATYGRIIENDYEQEKIPFFIDQKKGILGNPAVELIRSVLEVTQRDFSYESMFRYLRCEMVDISREAVDNLENYALAMGIRGFHLWTKEWDRSYQTQGAIDFIRLNESRKMALAGLEPLREVLKKKDSTVREMTTAICMFLVEKQVAAKLTGFSQDFDVMGKLSLAKEYRQVYGMILELFDKMVELLGEETMSLEEYSKLLDTGFEEIKVGIIPPSIDQIVVGDIERTRLKDIKALFFLGVNDGIIPKSADGGGLISDMERELLLKHEVELAPTKRQKTFTEQFYLYLNLTKPTKHLYITYSKVGMDGKAKKASYLIGKMKQIFPKLKVQDFAYEQDHLETILATRQGIGYLIDRIRSFADTSKPKEGFESPLETPTFQELYSWYCQDEERRKSLDLVIQGAFYEPDANSLSKAVARALYGSELNGSVTRLEKYAACAFAHFIRYGLGLLERQEYRLAVPDIGNIFHKAIDLFSKKVQKSEYEWYSIPDEVREQYTKEAVEEAAVDYGNQVILSSKRNAYMLARVMRITKRTIWALCKQVRKGKFRPEAFELQFSFLDHLDSVHVALSEEENMQLQGRIDRVDIYEEPEKNRLLVKVIDYKSGNSALDMGQIYYGLQLQLMVYLSASMEMQQKKNPAHTVEPAGVFYYNINDPIVDKTDDVDSAIMKELRMNGMVNADMSISKYMDTSFMEGEEIAASVKSDVIPLETNKEGWPTKRSAVASSRQFKEMTDYVNHKIVEIGKEILEGQADVNPYKLGEKTACDYCAFQGICGFDVKLPGNRYHQLKKLDKEDVFAKMECLLGKEEE